MTAPSLQLLLSTFIDFAGIFPPARLDLPSAVAAYRTYSVSPHRWMLGRFVLPLSQLPQFEHCLSRLEETHPVTFWPLSIVLEPTLEALETLEPWREKQDRFAISSLEFRSGSVDELATLLPQLPPHIDSCVELPLGTTLSNYLDLLQAFKVSAKVRTGGLTAADFPTVEDLARFIVTCAKAGISLKATAGLHHPLRSSQRLLNGTLVQMHGFLNVALAIAFAYGKKADTHDIMALLQIDTPNAFNFSEQGISWERPHYPQTSDHQATTDYLSLEAIAQVRSQYFQGIGSCSFQSPLAHLMQLGLLDNPSLPTTYALST